jgi:hypothetical protein
MAMLSFRDQSRFYGRKEDAGELAFRDACHLKFAS